MALKMLEDGRRIKRFIVDRNVRRVVIIGMGYTALEMREALRARGIEVDIELWDCTWTQSDRFEPSLPP